MQPSQPRYLEHLPAAPLRHLVECYWEWRGEYPPGFTRTFAILPDGCMDVLFVFESDVPAPGIPSASVVGTMTEAREVLYQGRIDLLGVRFRPGGAPALLGIEADELTDRTVDLDDVWGRTSEILFDRLRSGTGSQRRQVLDEELLSRLLEARTDGLAVRAAADLTSPSPASVQHVSDMLGIGRRQLERRIRAAVGLSPWGLARIARFRRAAQLLATHPYRSLSRIAHEAGYYDQPHFTKEFVRLAGRSPLSYRSELLE